MKEKFTKTFEVCKRCIDQRNGSKNVVEVMCLHQSFGVWYHDNCPYKLEHVVIGQDADVK